MSAERFLAAFNRVEAHLRGMTGEPPTTPFVRLVRIAADKPDFATRRYADDLLDFAEVRNVIVHRRGTSRDVIADPREWAVARMEQIEAELTRPATVIPAFQGVVTTVAPATSLAQALSLMGKGDFSQLPVYAEGRCLGLLTERAIARWLIAEAPGDLVSLDETRVQAVMTHREPGNNLALVGRDASVLAVAEYFRRAQEQGRPYLDAVLITHSGREDQQPLGIVTAWDVLGL